MTINNLLSGLLFVGLAAISLAEDDLVHRFQLRVNPQYQDEYKRPLPELAIFNPAGKCVYHGRGFGDRDHFSRILDQVFSGESVTVSKKPKDPVALEAGIREAVMANAEIPAEHKEAAIKSALKNVAEPSDKGQCELKLASVLNLMEERDGGAWDAAFPTDDTFILVEYMADWCKPCHLQADALEAYIDNNPVAFNWLIVERDAQKLFNGRRE